MVRDDSKRAKGDVHSPQESGFRQQEAAESLIDAVHAFVLLDTQGRIIQFNRYMEETSGYKLDEMRGRDWFTTFVPQCDQTRARAIFARAIEGANIHSNISTIVASDGRDRHIRWFDTVLRDGNHKVTHLLKIGYDVTGRRQAEDWRNVQEQIAALEQKCLEHLAE